MLWNNYSPVVNALAKAFKIDKELVPNGAKNRVPLNLHSLLVSELGWAEDGRPYYNIYPSIVEAFSKVDLGKLTTIDMPVRSLVIRFSGATKIKSIFVANCISSQNLKAILLGIDIGATSIYKNVIVPAPIVRGITFPEGLTIEEQIAKGGNDFNEEVTFAVKILTCLCLIKDNPDIIEREPLNEDRERWEATHDLALIERAEKRGKKEWAVGKHIEVTPGFRRPHFAIRWCGVGGNDPQLRPIKGCIVKKKIVEELPTGYLDDLTE